MIYAIYFFAALLSTLLALVTVVQVLYLESLRLRTRDLPSLRYFKEFLEDRMGLKTEQGAAAFSIVKHTIMSLLGVLIFASVVDGHTWAWQGMAEGLLYSWLDMLLAGYVVPQLLYRRSEGRGWFRSSPS